MKRFFLITGIIVIIIVSFYFTATDPVDKTPYMTTGYYKLANAHLDSIRKNLIAECDSILAGFSRVSITPGLGFQQDNAESGQFSQVPLAGYGARRGKSASGVHDSLFVKAIALKSGKKLLVFVTADLLIMPPNITDSVVKRLSEDGFRRDQMFFSATHSHSSLGAWGPGFLGDQFAGKENKNVEKWLVQQITLSVRQAATDLHLASIGNGSFEAGNLTRNRLIGAPGTKNNDFNFLVIDQIGKRKAVIGCFSAHSTTLGDENMEFSADYPGFWERKMESGLTDFALFFAGSMGSQSPAGKGEGFERARYVGEALADSLIRKMHGVKMNETPVLSSISLKMPLPEYKMRLTTKINLSDFMSRRLMPYPENPYLQVVKIGKLLWITTPSDFSGEYALELKNSLKINGFECMVTSFNGSYIGYIIPGRYFYLDKYEPQTMGWFGPYLGDYTMELIRHMTDIVVQ